jgi:hypothetical protein
MERSDWLADISKQKPFPLWKANQLDTTPFLISFCNNITLDSLKKEFIFCFFKLLQPNSRFD